MTVRARKQPERGGGRNRNAGKRRAAQPGGLQRLALALGVFAARHPSVIGGGAAFAVVFSFVAANALWYQPNGHPSPIMKTRLANNSLGFSALRKPPADVTTFVIEREGEPATDAAAGQAAQPSELVLDIQTELARQGFYAGDPDGRMQAATMSAIAQFQQARGLRVTGAPNEEVLAALQTDMPTQNVPAQVAVLPVQRPQNGSVSDAGVTLDPIAAAIRAADAEPAMAPVPVSAESSALVMKIQKGLSNIAYADITVDGVAGAKTRQAIRAFEKHYSLPTTGEPNDLVLSKLKEIGAL